MREIQIPVGDITLEADLNDSPASGKLKRRCRLMDG